MLKNKKLRVLVYILLTLLLIYTVLVVLQGPVAYSNIPYVLPTAEPVDLYEFFYGDELGDEDYAVIMEQTGLGKAATDSLRAQGDMGYETLMLTQAQYLADYEVQIKPMFFIEFFTKEHRLMNSDGETVYGPDFVDLRPGDILVSLSTHSIWGWYHGHAGLVIDEDTALESRALGENSVYTNLQYWRRYTSYAVLRVKGADEQMVAEVLEYAEEHLYDVPYDLLAGLGADKFESGDIGTQCGHLVWQAWQSVGVDLDSNGGRIVSPADLLYSDKLEVVQVYGLKLS